MLDNIDKLNGFLELLASLNTYTNNGYTFEIEKTELKALNKKEIENFYESVAGLYYTFSIEEYTDSQLEDIFNNKLKNLMFGFCENITLKGNVEKDHSFASEDKIACAPYIEKKYWIEWNIKNLALSFKKALNPKKIFIPFDFSPIYGKKSSFYEAFWIDLFIESQNGDIYLFHLGISD